MVDHWSPYCLFLNEFPFHVWVVAEHTMVDNIMLKIWIWCSSYHIFNFEGTSLSPIKHMHTSQTKRCDGCRLQSDREINFTLENTATNWLTIWITHYIMKRKTIPIGIYRLITMIYSTLIKACVTESVGDIYWN